MSKLNVIGIGCRLDGHLTLQARAYIESADDFLFLASDEVTEQWLHTLHPAGESLRSFVEQGPGRRKRLDDMAAAIVRPLESGRTVCAAFSGHPAICLYPSHEAVRLAREYGHEARLVPGISSMDCMFADLGIDPGESGSRAISATNFLVRRVRLDCRVPLIVLQIGLIGGETIVEERRRRLKLFTAKMLRHYPANHKVVIYEPGVYPDWLPGVQTVALSRLSASNGTSSSTLYIPAIAEAPVNAQMLRRLGLRRHG